MAKSSPRTQDQEKIVLEFSNKMVVLTLTQFDTDISADELTNIQYHNIIGEILTFPVIMNRVGNLKADMEEIVATTKMDFDIFLAQKQEEQRKKLTFAVELPKGGTKIDKPTKDEVENAVILTKEYRVMKTNLFKIQKNLGYVESLYWASRDKSNKLDTLSAKLKPEEFEKEILEGAINGVIIQVKKKSI